MTIGVFFGGKNTEHDISIITGMLVISTLKKKGHEVIPVYINREGEWNIGKELSSLAFFKQSPLPKLNSFNLDLEKSVGKMVFTSKGFRKKEYVIDMAFPCLHGQYGEDGTIQGLFEIVNMPYVGCEVASSAITIDKVLTKQFYKLHGFPTTNFLYYSSEDWRNAKKKILEEVQNLKWPLFVKPAKLGSSIGIAKVKNISDLESAIEVACNYGEKFLVEEAVENLMDITCAVIGNSQPQASLLQESVFEDELFSYDDKYLKDGGAQLGQAQKNIIIPASVDPATTEKIRQLSVAIYKKLECTGIARVDFLYNKQTKEVFANEINPLPGTLYHHLWKASGLEIGDLVEKLLEFAQERYQIKNSYTFTFKSDLLNLAQSIKLKIDSEE